MIQGIILKKTPFEEGSEIITIYTREVGKLRAIAKAVKFPKSKLSFALQVPFLSELELSGRKSNLITGVKSLQTFPKLREDLNKYYVAMFAIEVVLKATPDEEPNLDLFGSLLHLLEHLNESKNSKHSCVDLFVLNLLSLVGYRLTFDQCVNCSKSLVRETKVFFSNRKSGFLCLGCANKTSDAFDVNLNLRMTLSTHADFLAADQQAGDIKILHEFVSAFTSHTLERDLNTLRYLGKL